MAPDWLPLPGDWDYPQLLLLALAVTVLTSGLVAAGTSSTAFGAYNTAWDGASDLRAEADAVDTESVTALNTSAYEEVTPTNTVAVVMSPDQAYSTSDLQRMRRFVRQGGTLVVAEDFGPQGNRILRALGVESRFDGRLLRDERNYYQSPAIPLATNVSSDASTDGVDELTLNHGTVVTTNASASSATVLVRSSEFSYLDTNSNGELDDSESLRERPVVVREQVGDGTVYIVSDPSLFINVMLDRPGNQQFVRNLFDAHQTVLLDYSHQSGQPPLAVALLVIRDTAWLQVLIGLVGLAGVLRWETIAKTVGNLTQGGSDNGSPGEPPKRHEEDLLNYLQRQHPDWERDRLERIMRGILTQRGEEADDE